MSAGMVRIETLIDSMDQLTLLFTQEKALIAARDRDGLRELGEMKQRLARAHEEALRAIARDPVGLRELEAEERQRLQDAIVAFQAASLANAMAVQVALRATDALAATIVHAVNRAQELEGPPGGAGGYGRGSRAPASSFNQVL